MGNKFASRDFLAEPKICSSQLRGSWVYVVWDNPVVLELSDSMVLVNKTDHEQSVSESVTECSDNEEDTQATDDEGQECTTPGSSAEPAITEIDLVLEAEQQPDLVLEEEEEEEEEEDMEIGEVTEAKRAAIAATLRRHSARLCEGVSVTCLATILYTDNVMDSLVFVGIRNAPQKAQYLVREILQAVEDDATKFEALCHSISLAHSHAYTQQIWSDYKRELEKQASSEPQDDYDSDTM